MRELNEANNPEDSEDGRWKASGEYASTGRGVSTFTFQVPFLEGKW